MNILRSLKHLLACAFTITLITASAFAISKEKLDELQAKAESGNGISQYNLGLVYADPQEPLSNILEAYVWFSLAAENGAPGKALMIVSNQLTPDQLNEGKKLLEKRRAELAAPKSPVIVAASSTSETAKSPVGASPVIVAPAAPDNSALHAEIAATKAKLATAEASLAKAGAASAELATAKQNIASLNEQIQKLNAETQRLTALVKQTESTAETKSAASEKTINEINGELLKTQARLAEISNQSSIQNSVAANANTELAAQRQTNAELAAQTQKLTAEKDQAVAQAAKATAEGQQQIEALNARLATAEADLAKATAAQTELTAQLAAARIEITKANKDTELEARAKEIADLQAKLKDSEAALDAAKTAPVQTAAQTAEADGQTTALKKELDEAQTKLDVSLRSYQLQQNEIDRLKNALANIDNERAKLAERLETANAEVANAANKAAANNDAAGQLAGVREQLRQTQNQLASVAYENAEMKRRIAFNGPAPQAGTITPVPIALPTSFNTPSRPGAAKPAATEAAPTPAATPRTHTVVTGDTLSLISKRYYGSTSRWTEILEANKPTLKDPSSLRVGMKLKIP